MYNAGDYIVYGDSGVCLIKEIGRPALPGIDSARLYYTLRPLRTTETIYTPVDTPVFMRPVISRREALDLIQQIPAIERSMDMQETVGGRALPEYYRSLLHSHDCEDLVRLILMTYTRARRAQREKRKVGQADQNFLRDAQNILYGELSVALGIAQKSVSAFIQAALGCPKEKSAAAL